MQNRAFGKMGYDVSLLGMGCMRLPRIINTDKGEAVVDTDKALEIIRYAVEHGVSYFDTAYGYHHTTSEAVLGEALDYKGYRDRVKVVTKQPFHVMKSQDDVRRNLENTLKKLRSSYVDVYLIHCITKGNWDEIKARKILDEFEKFRSEGLIRGIGFSYHGQFPTFKDVISGYHWDMCMVQQNFMDVESEATAEAIHVAGEKGCALAIMEPLRGGGLATPPKSIQAVYDEFPVKRSAVEWAFRHLANYKEVSAIVSGVTTLEQLKENIEIFNKPDLLPGCLSGDEAAVLARVRGMYQSFASIPCTGCEYCMPCPNGVNISGVFSRYNDSVMFGHSDQSRRSYFFVSNSKQGVSQCTACGVCEDKCPQNIPIVKDLQTAHAALKGWIE